MKTLDRFLPYGGWAILCVCLLMNACKTPPPDRPYASDEVAPVTEQPRDVRPAPTAPPQPYVFHTNAQHDALIEQQVLGPPVLPGRGPFPMHVIPNTPAVSNWVAYPWWMKPKAKALEPKPMGTNQIPGSVILTRITTTDKDGKKFTAELTLVGDQTVYANDKMSLVIFAIYQTNFVVEFCTNLTDGIWHTMSSGVGQNTNSALAIFDLHEGTKPVNFYRRKPAP